MTSSICKECAHERTCAYVDDSNEACLTFLSVPICAAEWAVCEAAEAWVNAEDARSDLAACRSPEDYIRRCDRALAAIDALQTLHDALAALKEAREDA